MIITRAPLRITLGGGGTDLPSYSDVYGGFCMAAAIDKYVYITLHHNFTPGIVLKYSKMERVESVDQIEHPIIRECFKLLDMDGDGLEICAMADIPAGTGLGSSSSFTCALLLALHAHRGDLVSPLKIAEEACVVEIERCKEPIGRQDQYIAAHGGIMAMRFSKTGQISCWRIPLGQNPPWTLQDNLLLFYTGLSRSASAILKDQDDRTKTSDSSMVENLHYIKTLAYEAEHALTNGEYLKFGRLMHTHWEHKQARGNSISNPSINEWYKIGMENGALGGKLIGAGGGGFLMFYAHEHSRLRQAMAKCGLREVRFAIENQGAKILQ